MRVWTRFEWEQQSRLIEERDRLILLSEELRAAATSRLDYEPQEVPDDEAAIQAGAIEDRLVAMNEALARIDTGRYGKCIACGTGIADERLKALPAAALCRDCAG